MPDGSVWIKTKIDNSDAHKQVEELEKEMKSLTSDIQKNENAKLPYQQQLEEYGKQLDEAKAKLTELSAAQERIAGLTTGTIEGTPEEVIDAFTSQEASAQAVKEQQAQVDALNKKWDAAAKKVDLYNAKINAASERLGVVQEEAGRLTHNMTGAGIGAKAMAAATEKASKSAQRFGMRLKEVLRSALIFTIISQAAAKLRNMIAANLKTNEEYAKQLGQLKAAWLTAFQPIWETIIPALLYLMRVLTAVANAISRVFSFFSGKSTSQMAENAKALDAEKKALDGVGGAADGAQKQLAGFDEINKLSEQSGGGGGGGDTISADFSGFGSQMLELKDKILLLGAAAAIAGALFGGLGAGIALVIGGAILLYDAITDIIENGLNAENVLTLITGLIAAGLGIAILTGSWIPLLIAGIAGALAAILYFTGNGEKFIDGLKNVFKGLIDFIVGVFTGDWERAIGGINEISLGIQAIFSSIVDSIEQLFLRFLTWLDEKTNGKFSLIIEDMKMLIHYGFQGIKNIFRGLINFIVDVFTGDWESAWQTVVDIFNRIFGPVISLIQTAIDKMREFNRQSSIDAASTAVYQPNAASVASVPALASGAVIPPNQKFLAVLGDQKSGTNVEAPLSTIQQAVRSVLSEGGFGGNQTVILELDGRELGRATYKVYNQESQRLGAKLGGV